MLHCIKQKLAKYYRCRESLHKRCGFSCKMGAFDYLPGNAGNDELISVLKKTIDSKEGNGRKKNSNKRQALHRLYDLPDGLLFSF